MSDADDSVLVQSSLDGDSRAFEMLIERYEKPLYNAAYRITRNRQDALDVTQTAFLKAYRELGTFDFSYRFFSWIFRIVVNESLNLVKKSQRHAETAIDFDPPSKARNPEERCGAEELGHQVQLAVMNLSADQRVVVVLKHFHGFSYREISQIVGVPITTIKSRLFEARRALRTILEQQGRLL